jgi:signal transduction histidine kinase
VVVEIEDTGIGISAANLKEVFVPFFTTKGPDGGTGLGLSVTKNIIDMHKGLIDIQSKTGEGTKVIISLKVAKEGRHG